MKGKRRIERVRESTFRLSREIAVFLVFLLPTKDGRVGESVAAQTHVKIVHKLALGKSLVSWKGVVGVEHAESSEANLGLIGFSIPFSSEFYKAVLSRFGVVKLSQGLQQRAVG